jgi:hypothetical protein
MSQLIRNSSTCFLVLMITPAIYADDVSTTTAQESPAPLSVAPLDHVEYPKDRPEWIKKSTDFDTEAHAIVVVSGPSDSAEQSKEELNWMAREAVSAYVTRITDAAGNDEFYSISEDEIDRDLVVRRYSGKLTKGDDTMYEEAVELVFTEGKRDEIKAAWTNVAVRERLGALGLMVFGGLVMLMCSSAVVGVVSRRAEQQDAERLS